MTTGPYEKFSSEKLILRDWLAADRTVLANERTFLAYIRTSLTEIIVGVGLIGYFETGIYAYIGSVLVPIGIITFVVGLYRFIKTRRALSNIYERKKER